MCLLSKRFFPIRAKEDIKCYKVLSVIDFNVKTPYTYYLVGRSEWKYNNQTEIYELKGIEFNSLVLKPEFSIVPYVFSIRYDKYNPGYEISKGFIHSYSSTKYLNTESWKGKVSNVRKCNITLECIIPKGTLYYVGNDDDYASRKLIINKII